MKLFKVFGGSPRVASGSRVAREQLPEVNAFVEVAVGGDARRRQSIPVDAIDAQTFSMRLLPGLDVGTSADFVYTTPAGRFRFTTVCCRLDTRQAHFETPLEVRTLSSFGGKRSSVRFELVLPAQWRFAPDGKGNGEFEKGAMCDISRGGAALTLARDVKNGAYLEVRFSLEPASPPIVALGQVLRSVKIAKSGKSSAAIRFVDLSRSHEDQINTFIREHQLMRRDRGVV